MNILIFRVGSLGDSIVALDVVYTIKTNNKDSKIYVLCNINEQDAKGTERVDSVLNTFELLDGSFLYSKRIDILKLKSFIKNKNITKLYYLMPNRNFFQKYRDYIIFKLMRLRVEGIGLFEIDENKYTKNYLYESEKERLMRKIDHLERHKLNYKLLGKKNSINMITICTGTRHMINDWGLENWTKLLQLIFNKKERAIINIIGSVWDLEIANYLKKIQPNSINNYCNKLSILESVEIIANSNVYIGHDSGPMHLATLTDTPIVVLFSHKNKPGIWYPERENVSILRNKVIRDIKPWWVCEIALGMLNSHDV